MCGRFANALPTPQYRSAVRDQLPPQHPPQPAPDSEDYNPSFNVAPQTRCPVVRRELTWERERRLRTTPNPTPLQKEHQLIIQTMRWGLIPRFHKHPPSHGEAYKTINARDDTILSSQRSIWHPLLPAQRCVVFVQGFYEWQKKGSEGEKVERIPHFVGMTEPGQGRADKTGTSKRLMPLAGLWERCRFDGEDKPLYTFTIVTTASNDQLGFLHDRMPVILPSTEAISTWLGLNATPKTEGEVKKGADVDDTWSLEVAKLLRPLKGELECYKVPKEVGKVGNSDESFILPVEERKDGLKAFFAKAKVKAEDKVSTKSTRKEHVGGSQDSEALMPSSSEDAQAMLVAQQVEEDAAMAEAAAKVEQEEQDRMIAEMMQREEEGRGGTAGQGGVDMGRSESIVNIGHSSGEERLSTQDSIKPDSVKGEEIGDGFPVPDPNEVGDDEGLHMLSDGSGDDDASLRPTKRSPSSEAEPSPKRAKFYSHIPTSSDTPSGSEPSGRFSPDPFNPPLSPPRPRGGFSRRLSNGTIHVNPKRGKSRGKPHEPFPQAPPHTWKSPPKVQRGPMDDALQRQRDVAAREMEDEARKWRELSPSRNANADEARADTSPRKRLPSKNGKAGASTGASINPAAGADIRAFFSPTKKKS